MEMFVKNSFYHTRKDKKKIEHSYNLNSDLKKLYKMTFVSFGAHRMCPLHFVVTETSTFPCGYAIYTVTPTVLTRTDCDS